MFASTDWFGEQVINFDDPDENGIRILHFAPRETQELDFLTESEPDS